MFNVGDVVKVVTHDNPVGQINCPKKMRQEHPIGAIRIIKSRDDNFIKNTTRYIAEDNDLVRYNYVMWEYMLEHVEPINIESFL